jgi:hypothetical protein
MSLSVNMLRKRAEQTRRIIETLALSIQDRRVLEAYAAECERALEAAARTDDFHHCRDAIWRAA